VPPDTGRVRETALFLALLAAGALLREWTSAERLAGMDFPLPLDPFRAAVLLAGVALAFAAAFALAGRGFLAGLAVGLALGPAGWCAARWQSLGRAVELSGSAFFGWLLAAATVPLLALTAAFLVEAVVDKQWRPRAPRLAALAAGLWLLPTFAGEALLSKVWGYGPASLAEAAEVPTKADAQVMTVAWLYPARGEAVRVEDRRMSDERVDLSPESLAKLETFLERRRLRDVFADDALAAVRRGWLLWWEAERALDAAMLAVPGRAGPDYRRALELLRAGPLNDARLAKLRQLDAAATQNRRAGFEGVTASQYIFEGFSGAYARFGLEDDARRWLYKIDDLWPVNDKRIEVTPIEDMRDGRIAGRLLQDGRGVSDVRVGLFFAWRSTATNSTHYFLSGSVFPDADGRFEFDALGPGRYHLALMGARERLAGGVRGSPGFIELGYDRPDAMLAPIRLGWGGGEEEAGAAPSPAEEPFHRGTFLPVPGRAP
jgi:hypothetical protein